MTKLRIIHWNIKYNTNIEQKTNLLRSYTTDNCIINLLEVSSEKSKELSLAFNAAHSAHSLDYRPKGYFERENRDLGIYTISTSRIESAELIACSVFPERTLLTTINCNGTIIKNLAFHSLTGCDYKKAKSSNFASLASHIHHSQPDIMTCDMNEPNKDSDDINEVEFFPTNGDKGKSASFLIGEDKCHTLTDSCRYFTKTNNFSVADYYTHVNQKKKKRYDYIFVNPGWKIKNHQRIYDEAIDATSDHALLVTDVTFE